MSLSRFGSVLFRGASLQTSHATLFKTRGVEGFFDSKLRNEDQLKPIRTGRSWKAVELRKKSFEDLHKLWFVFLKEKNLLMTERENLGHEKSRQLLISSRLSKVCKGMARLLTVIAERTNAFKKKKRLEALKAEQEAASNSSNDEASNPQQSE